MSFEVFSRTREVIEAGIEKRLHHGAQIYVSQKGSPLLDAAIGTNGQGTPLAKDDLLLWMSAGKPVVSAAIGILVDQQRLDWDSRLSEFLPAMDSSCAVTIRQLLTHTAGLPDGPIGWPEAGWNTCVENAVRLAKECTPMAAYSPHVAWFLLGEVVALIQGTDFSQAIRTLVLDPCGMKNSFNGMTDVEFFTNEELIGPVFQRERGQLVVDRIFQSDSARVPLPGGNWRGPIRELGRFYECVAGYKNGSPLIRETWDDMTSPHRVGEKDATFQHIVDFGLGVIVNSSQHGVATLPYGFGTTASAATYGHGGSQCSIGFCDREHDLVVAWTFNGRPGEGQHQRRNLSINEAIYADLEIATGD